MYNQHTKVNSLNNNMSNQNSGLNGYNQHNVLGSHSMTDNHGILDHHHCRHGLGSGSDHLNGQNTEINNTPIYNRFSQHNFDNRNSGMMPQRSDMNNYPIDSPENGMHNQSTFLGQDNNIYDQSSGHHSHLHNQGSSHYNPSEKAASMVHYDKRDFQQNKTGNLSGATVHDVKCATHPQADPPFAPGVNELHNIHDGKHHSSKKMPPASGEFIGNSTTRAYPSHDLYQVESNDSTPKAVPNNHLVLGSNAYSQNAASTSQPFTEKGMNSSTMSPSDHHFFDHQSSNMSPTDRQHTSHHSSNMLSADSQMPENFVNMSPEDHRSYGHPSSNTSSADRQKFSSMTPASHSMSGNNNTSLLNKTEHLRNRDGISSVSSAPSECGTSDNNVSSRIAYSQDVPVADKNAFIDHSHVKKHWQHSMSPADRAKKLGAEMEEVLQSRKSPEKRSLKIGEKKEYQLD